MCCNTDKCNTDTPSYNTMYGVQAELHSHSLML